jgi:hypothetical protein
MLQKLDPQQLLCRSLGLRGQRIGQPSAFLAHFGVAGLDQVDQHLSGRHRPHLREKLLPFGLLLGGGLLVIREAEALAIYQPSSGLQSRGHCPEDGLSFPESP